MKFKWIQNSDGKPDAILTFSLIAFMVVVLKVLLAGASIEFAGNKYDAGSVDASVIAALLGPTLGAYVTRRWTDKKYAAASPDVPDPPTDDREEARKSIS